MHWISFRLLLPSFDDFFRLELVHKRPSFRGKKKKGKKVISRSSCRTGVRTISLGLSHSVLCSLGNQRVNTTRIAQHAPCVRLFTREGSRHDTLTPAQAERRCMQLSETRRHIGAASPQAPRCRMAVVLHAQDACLSFVLSQAFLPSLLQANAPLLHSYLRLVKLRTFHPVTLPRPSSRSPTRDFPTSSSRACGLGESRCNLNSPFLKGASIIQPEAGGERAFARYNSSGSYPGLPSPPSLFFAFNLRHATWDPSLEQTCRVAKRGGPKGFACVDQCPKNGVHVPREGSMDAGGKAWGGLVK